MEQRKAKPLHEVTIKVLVRAKDEAEATAYAKRLAEDLTQFPVCADAYVESFSETMAYLGTRTWN